MINTHFLLEIALILICTKAFALFTKKLQIPQVVGALVAGVVLGPAVLGIIRQTEVLQYMAEIGVILLMFNAGMETDFTQLKESLKSTLVIALMGILLPLGGGFAIAYAFGEGALNSIFIGVILTATSVSITVETLQEMGKIKTKVGTAILGAAIIDDVLGIIILAAIMQIGSSGNLGLTDIAFVLVKIFGFFIIALVIGYLVYRIFAYLDSKIGPKKRVSIIAVAFCFFLAYFAELFGVANIIGAYIAGIILCNTKSAKYVEQKTDILSYLLFSPIFFVSIGLMTTFDGLSSRVLLFSGLLLFVAVFTKIVGCGFGARLCRFNIKESVQIGTGMVSRGEVALIVAAKGVSANLMNTDLFSSVILVVIITTLITPILLKIAFKQKEKYVI
jgi:Kef-type K+ transport system membrane component KefB